MERFWNKVDKTGPNGCWLWTGGKTGSRDPNPPYTQYGAFHFNGTMQRAHRIAYLLYYGAQPKVISHTCHRRDCVNPHHLEASNQSKNIQQAVNRGTHRTPFVPGHTRTFG